jgi:FixJ family two-component response regulator
MTLAHALVYVIDDDLSMRKAIGRLLESEDYRVELLTGAREFLARAPQTILGRCFISIVSSASQPKCGAFDVRRNKSKSRRFRPD